VKISRSSKARAFGRRHLVTRCVHESQRNYRWWREQDTEPPEGYLLETWTTHERVYPPAPKVVTRLPKHAKLSRRALRKRLYQNHVPKALWPGLVSAYAGRSVFRMAGEPSLKESSGFAIAKAVTRHVVYSMVFVDEFHSFAAPLLARIVETFRSCRKFNAGVQVVQQEAPAGLDAGAAAALAPASV
jgi:hypothetical protein